MVAASYIHLTMEKDLYNDFRIPVPTGFEKVFSHFYFAGNTSDQTITKTLLPSYQTIFVFSFGSNVLLESTQNTQLTVDKCLVLGTIKRAFTYSLPPGSSILVAALKDDAFYRFFGSSPATENLPIDPCGLVDGNCFTALWYELNKIDNPDEQVRYILEFCRPYLREQSGVAQQLLDYGEGSLSPIKTVATHNSQSERSIQIKQKKYFGYSVKELSRYRRFLKAIKLIEDMASKGAKEDWFRIIHECGYYDQSQLIGDFKHYINLSPTRYLKFQKEICNPNH